MEREMNEHKDLLTTSPDEVAFIKKANIVKDISVKTVDKCILMIVKKIIIKGQFTTGLKDKKRLDINLTNVVAYDLLIKAEILPSVMLDSRQ
ncbi:unnamed protein product [Rotaria socialis]|uniref:Uncharacterized protein n=1 Tax=Rotaria socialis TaxID=392032 RepID=A0A820LZ17_9BILA|nr:unnamed protein product [Rotaria socialis]